MTSYSVVDLFSGAGGTAMGLWQAGFRRIVGIDIINQPHYPFTFRRDDAMQLLSDQIDTFKNWADAIHAAPPCQGYSVTKSLHDNYYPLLLSPLRELLDPLGIPYVMENVSEAWWDMKNPITLCGSSFGLRVRRHRLFESNIPLRSLACDHDWQDQDKRYRIMVSKGRLASGYRMSGIQPVHGGGHNHNSAYTPDDLDTSRGLFYKSVAMGIDWMNNDEINEAIPPAYGKYIGQQLISYIKGQNAS